MYLPFIRLFKKGDPVREVANVQDHNRLANFFNDLQGIGCRVVKPVNGEGRGCRIIVGDGNSDVDTGDLPFDPPGPKSYNKRILKIAATDSIAGDKGKADYTCDGISDEDEINAAIMRVGAGGTIFLYAGTYTIDGWISASAPLLQIQGASEASVIIQPAAGYSNVAIYAIVSAVNADVNSCNFLAVRDLTIRNNGANTFLNGIRTVPSQMTGTVVIEDVTITGCSNYGVYIDMDGFLFCNDVAVSTNYGGLFSNAHAVLKSVTASNSTSAVGIYIKTGIVDTCTASSNGTKGIYCTDFAIVKNCTASSNSAEGIYGASYVLNSVASSNTTDGIYGAEIVTNCTASGNGTTDITCEYGSGNTYTNGTIADNADDGAAVSQVVVTSVDFGAQTTTTKTLVSNATGRITSFA